MKTTQSMKQTCITFMALRESETSVNGTRRSTRYLIIWQSMNGSFFVRSQLQYSCQNNFDMNIDYYNYCTKKLFC